MKELLNKIHQAQFKDRCKVWEFVRVDLEERVNGLLVDFDAQLEVEQPGGVAGVRGQSLDVEMWDRKMDEFEQEIEPVMEAMECLLLGLDGQVILRLRKKLSQDYDENIADAKYFGWLNDDGKSYMADLGKMAGKKIILPSKEEVMKRLTPTYLKQYLEMEKKKLAPRLQITPMAISLKELGYKLDKKQADLNSKISDTIIWEEIKEQELLFEPTAVNPSDRAHKIQIKGAINWEEWVDKYNACLVDLVPTKQNLDSEIKMRGSVPSRFNKTILEADLDSIQAQRHFERAKSVGKNPMNFWNYLVAQMAMLKKGKAMDEDRSFSLLLDSNFRNNDYLLHGSFSRQSVVLHMGYAVNRSEDLRMRCTVRVL